MTMAATKVGNGVMNLRPRDKVFVNLDLAQTGLGTASCGPGVLPKYELRAACSTWSVILTPDQGHGESQGNN